MNNIDATDNSWVYCDPLDLKVAAPFCELFTISPQILADVVEDMRLNGFRQAYPIVAWRTGNVVVDGHTRRQAALNASIKDVPVCYMDFPCEDDAVIFAIKSQVRRRNLTEPELLRSIQELDKRRNRGGDHKSEKSKASRDAFDPQTSHKKSAEETGSILGVSASKVERARSVLNDPEVKKKVMSGKTTINKGSKEAREKKQRKDLNKRSGDSGKVGSNGHVKRNYPMPLPEPKKEPKPEIVRTEDDEEWLESFPIREKVRTRYFDDDALLYREFGLCINGLRNGRVTEIIGQRSPQLRSLLHRVLHRLSRVQPIEKWEVCSDCGGRGTTGQGEHFKECKDCHGGGYLIF